jgi:hypothetical protein
MIITAVVDPDDPTYINSPGWQIHSWCELQLRIARIVAQSDYHAILAACTDTACEGCREDASPHRSITPDWGEGALREEDLHAYSLDDDDRCRDYLMEDGWEEGHECTLPLRHAGPHRAASNNLARQASINDAGKHYTWAYEWAYGPGRSPEQAIKTDKEGTDGRVSRG